MENQQNQTNICKNFTDALAFFAAFLAGIFVLIQKKEFVPTGDILKFHQVEETRTYIVIAAVFFASALISALSRRLPTLSLPISIFPFCVSFMYYDNEMLAKRPMIFILMGIVHFSGSLIHVGQWFADSREYAKNPFRATLSGFIHSGMGIALWVLSKRFLAYRWALWLKKPIFYFLALGMVSALLGIIWFFLTPKEQRKEQRLWMSVISALCCFLVLVLKYFTERLGII